MAYTKEQRKAYREENREKILAQKKVYREENKKKIAAYQKVYRKENKEQQAAYNKAYNQENKEKILAQKKVYREENKEKIAARDKVYKQKNKEKIAATKKVYQRERYKNDPDFKMKETLRGRLRLALKGNLKAATTMELIGCTVAELWLHIEGLFEPGMTRENNGNGEGFWHLDHKIPCCSFDFSDPEQQKICFHYTNLQPLWCKDNLAKGAKYNEI